MDALAMPPPPPRPRQRATPPRPTHAYADTLPRSMYIPQCAAAGQSVQPPFDIPQCAPAGQSCNEAAQASLLLVDGEAKSSLAQSAAKRPVTQCPTATRLAAQHEPGAEPANHLPHLAECGRQAECGGAASQAGQSSSTPMGDLPENWRAIPSRSRPGQYSFIHVPTGLKQSKRPSDEPTEQDVEAFREAVARAKRQKLARSKPLLANEATASWQQYVKKGAKKREKNRERERRVL